MQDEVIQEDDAALYTQVSNTATHIPRSRNQGTRFYPLNGSGSLDLWEGPCGSSHTMWVLMEHSQLLSRLRNKLPKKLVFFSCVSTSIPLMFLGDLYSSCMYPGKHQVGYLNGERFKSYGY